MWLQAGASATFFLCPQWLQHQEPALNEAKRAAPVLSPELVCVYNLFEPESIGGKLIMNGP